MENAQATISSHNNADNFLVGSAGAAGGLYNAAVSTCSTSSTGVTTCSPIANYSFNPSPDIIAKAVFEPGFGHYEVFGIYSRFRDRVFPCGEVASATALCGAARLRVRTLWERPTSRIMEAVWAPTRAGRSWISIWFSVCMV